MARTTGSMDHTLDVHEEQLTTQAEQLSIQADKLEQLEETITVYQKQLKDIVAKVSEHKETLDQNITYFAEITTNQDHKIEALEKQIETTAKITFGTGLTAGGSIEAETCQRINPQPTGNMSFSAALDYMRNGRKLTRRSWRGAFVASSNKLPGASCIDTYLYIDTRRVINQDGDVFRGRVPWTPIQADLMADDWELYDG